MDNYLITGDQSDDRRSSKLRSDTAFRNIRADIIRGSLVPNARLRLEELRDRYEIGFSPIREALMQLHSEGLVVLERMKGFRVASISIEHLQDLARVRIEMEGTAIRWSIEYGDVDWEADILGAFHRLSKRKKMHDEMNSGIDPYWRDAHRAFHTALMAACRSPLLISICDSLFDQAERYVALSIRHIDQPRNDIGEHEGIMHAALARDARSAIELTQQHIGRTAEKVAAASAMFSEKAG